MQVSDVTTQFPDKVAIQALINELKAYADSIATGDIDLSNYVTKSELQEKLDALDINIDLSSYATKEELTNAINSIDLSAYAKKTDIPSLEGYVTETELNSKGYLTEHQDLSAYATKGEIPSLDGYATKTYVDNAVSNVPSTDLTDYYTKEETDNLINNIPTGGTTDLTNYYTKDETYNKEEVNNLIPTVPKNISVFTNDSGYATQSYVDNAVSGSTGVIPAFPPYPQYFGDEIVQADDWKAFWGFTPTKNCIALFEVETTNGDRKNGTTMIVQFGQFKTCFTVSKNHVPIVSGVNFLKAGTTYYIQVNCSVKTRVSWNVYIAE